MSVDLSGEITAIATVVLAAFAIITAWYARRAFLKQSQEVSDQASMLKVQSGQLDEQRKINAEQTRVLALQAEELRTSLEERRGAQASMVFITTETGPDLRVTQVQRAVDDPGPEMITARVKNASNRPIYSAELVWDDGSAQLAELAARSHADRLPVVIMPDGDAAGVREFGPDARAVALRFRDAAGVIWLRGPEGELVDISGPAKSADPGT